MSNNIRPRYLNDIRTKLLAEELIRRGVRPPIVQALTEVSISVARSLWKQTHGTSSPRGLCKYNATSFIPTMNHALHASIFYMVYRRHNPKVEKSLDTNRVIEAFDSYKLKMQQLGIDVLLDCTACIYIARDLRTCSLEPVFCRTCRVSYLYNLEARSLSKCPFCHEREKVFHQISRNKDAQNAPQRAVN